MVGKHIGQGYKSGDPPPSGYVQWHEWAEVQHKAGYRQAPCKGCGKYLYPQEKVEHDCADGPLVLGVDPGPTESAYALVAPDYTVILADKVETTTLYIVLDAQRPAQVVIESLQSYGMPVGRSVFETAYTVGKLLRECERLGIPTTLCCRQEYARAICGTTTISDAILRRVLELRFGGYRKGEPLHLLHGNSDKRSAYALAVYWLDCRRLAPRVPAVGSR